MPFDVVSVWPCWVVPEIWGAPVLTGGSAGRLTAGVAPAVVAVVETVGGVAGGSPVAVVVGAGTLVALFSVPPTYADTGQVFHFGPCLHAEASEVKFDWAEFWLSHGPPSRSRKKRVPPRPRSATQ